MGSGEFPVVAFSLSKRVVSIDAAVGLVPLLETTGRERSGVGATGTVYGPGEGVT